MLDLDLILEMIINDQIGNKIELKETPKKIISLVPSITETLFDLGLKENIVGITKYCVEPKGLVESIPKIGGTKKIDIEQILSLNPDIVVANKEENQKEQIEELMKYVPVWVSNVVTLDDAMSMISSLGLILGKQEKATELVENMKGSLKEFSEKLTGSKYYAKSVLYFIWRKPYMVVGKETFINSVLEMCSLQNIGVKLDSNSRYPKVEPYQLLEISPDLVFLSTEPYPFSERHLPEFQTLFPESVIRIVRGDYFSWYGSRILKAIDYFYKLLEV